MQPVVTAVSFSPSHTFSKPTRETIKLIEDYGVEGDAHAGKTVKHRFLAGKHPVRPNILQVHLIQSELLDKLAERGFSVLPGELGENITTRGIEFLDLPAGSLLRIGKDAIVKLTALRSPCKQIDVYQMGLHKEFATLDANGKSVMEGAVMGIVLAGGEVKPGDIIQVETPPKPHQKLVYTW